MATLNDLRRRLAEWHITTLGWVLIVLVPAAFLVFLFGPSAAQAPALIVGLIVLLAISLEGASMSRARGFSGMRTPREQRERRARQMPSSAPLTEASEADEEHWRRERERRERDSPRQ